MRPRDAREGSGSRFDNVEDSIKVAEADVISLTARDSEGDHGRMACHGGEVDEGMQEYGGCDDSCHGSHYIYITI